MIRDIAPIAAGAKDWQPSAFSPRTGLLYIPHQTMSMDYEGVEANYIAGTPYVGANVKMYADPVDPGDGSRGAFTAWDPVHEEAGLADQGEVPGLVRGRWRRPATSSSTARWRAGSRRSTPGPASVLWKFKTGSGIIGQPITYRGPDGKQYVAILSGVGGWAGAIVSGDLDAARPDRRPRASPTR